MDFKDWLEEISSDKFTVFVKRLSANDTGLTGSNQVGSYIPKTTLGDAFPSFRSWKGTPKAYIQALIESHGMPEKEVAATFYESKNEGRLTSWVKGVGNSPMQDAENTGALTVFAFELNGEEDCETVKVWICKNLEEEEYFEKVAGNVDPDTHLSVKGHELFQHMPNDAENSSYELPESWKSEFPAGKEIISFLYEQPLTKDESPDKRIVKFREYELALFMEIEKAHVFPKIQRGFDNVDDFVALANSVLNRRKSRSGKSLELHLEIIFQEEGLNNFGTQCVTEGRKKPDFLFPSCQAYHDDDYPQDKLRMLAVKTTLKDRWRQVLNEADKISDIYLFTLQKGVSKAQFDEMVSERVKLVVPDELHKSYPQEIRNNLISLKAFISDIKSLYV